jgi:hypothetical protein
MVIILPTLPVSRTGSYRFGLSNEFIRLNSHAQLLLLKPHPLQHGPKETGVEKERCTGQ